MLDDLMPICLQMPSGTDVHICPIADLHYGSPQFREKEWNKFVEKVLADESLYIVIAGDCIDNSLRMTGEGSPYDNICRPSEQKKWLAEQLKPIKDRILCATGGNHEARSRKDADDNPLYDVLCRLGIEERYRESACFVMLRIGDREKKTPSRRRPAYNIVVSHGAGGGARIGSGLNRVERFAQAIDGADIIITGHTHKPADFPAGKLQFDSQNKQIIQKQFVCVTATSWLNYGGYPIGKMLPPSAYAEQEIILSSLGKGITVINKY